MQTTLLDAHHQDASRNHIQKLRHRQVERRVFQRALRREAGEGRLRGTETGGGRILVLRP